MASQSGRRLLVTVTLALLVLVAPGGTERTRAADLFDEIYRRGAPMEAKLQAISASFVETTSSTLLAKPLVLRGRVVAQRPSNVVLTYDVPDARVVRIVDGRLTVDWPARGLHETKDVRSSLQRATRTILGKTPDELRKLFDITAVGAPDVADTWKVTFVPKRRQLREGVERLHLWIGQHSLLLQALEMELPGGDTRRMDFSNVVVNPPLDASGLRPGDPALTLSVTAVVQALMSWARRRRVLVLVLASALAVTSLVPLSRLRFDADVLHLLPRDTGAVQAFDTYLDAFGSLDALYVYVEAPEGYGIDDYRDLIDALTTRLRALPEVVRVDASPLDPDKDWSYLTDRQLLLLDDATLARALARMEPDEVRARVAASRDLLVLGSPDIKALVQRDPLGWFELLRPTLGGSTPLLQADQTRTDGYVTTDGRAQLLLVHPTHPPFDTDFARALIDAVHTARLGALADVAELLTLDELPAPRIDIAGGHRTSIETETLVRSEAISNTIWSSVGILGVLYLAFRSVWVVVFGGVPILLATMVTLGAHQLLGIELSAAATGSSAMLFGLGDDGLVLLFVAYREALARGLTPQQAVATLGGTGVSILLGAVTTTATFLGLWFMSFPSLQQLGVIVGVGILVTAFLTLTVLVAGLPGPAWASRARDLTLPGLARFVTRWRRPILAVSLIMTVPLAVGLTYLRVDPTIERLRPRGEGYAVEQEIGMRFGLPQDVYLVVDRDSSLDALLERADALRSDLLGVPGVLTSGPTSLLPTDAAQTRRADALAAARARAASTADAVDAAGQAQGFVPGTFAPFRTRLATVLDPAARLTSDGYASSGLGDLVGRFVTAAPDGGLVAVTYVTPETPAARQAVEAAVARRAPMVLTGLPVVNGSLSARLPRELALGLGVGALVVILLIWLEFRAVVPTLHALVPTVLGLVWGLGALGWAGVVLDLFSVFAVLMFLGIGVDYGIHLVHPTLRGSGPASPERAIAMVGPAMLLAGVTTLVGFGTLIRSEYMPLHSLGMASVATIGMSLIAALFTLPALLVGRSRTP